MCCKILTLVSMLLSQAPQAPHSIYLVANQSVTLTASGIRELYLGEREFDGTLRLLPVENNAATMTFVVRVLQMEPGRYAKLWLKKSFREGLKPPQTRATDSEVLAYVTQTRGAVGYVSSPPQSGAVKVIGEF